MANIRNRNFKPELAEDAVKSEPFSHQIAC